MVLEKCIKKLPVLVLFISLAVMVSCEDQGFTVKCPDCLADEPTDVVLDIKIDPSPIGNETKITVYEGNLEDNIVYWTVTLNADGTSVRASLNKKYTVTATYNKSGNYYTAVDSATPRVRYEKNQCDNPCYFVYDNSVDLRLKHIH